jgi:hypothetical protein
VKVLAAVVPSAYKSRVFTDLNTAPTGADRSVPKDHLVPAGLCGLCAAIKTNLPQSAGYCLFRTAKRCETVNNMPCGSPKSNIVILFGISLFGNSMAVQLPLLKGQYRRRENIRCSHE